VRLNEPEQPEAPSEPDIEEAPSQELVAALAGGGALSFEPDVEEEDVLLPGARVVAIHPRTADSDEGPTRGA
jgi:hypothetical protein